MKATRAFPWRRGAQAALTLLVAAAVTFAQLAVPVATPQASAATIDTNAWYVLVNRNSGKALEVADLSTANNAGIQQWARNDHAVQQWQFVSSGSGYYRLKSRHSGKVIDVASRSTADGANVVQYTDNNATNQQFSVQDPASGYIQLINRNSGKSLEVWEWSTADGGRVSQYTDTNANNQQWQMVRVGDVSTPTTYPNPGPVTGDTIVHDPEVVKRPDGSYLLANTGEGVNLRTSTDRTAWRAAGMAFPNGMPWVHTYTNNSNHVWAPDVHYVNGRYYMYYSASVFESNRSAIFLATSTTGAAGSWTNQGLVISSSASNDWNAIDPNLVIDQQGRWFLSFGSFWSGIKMIALSSSTGLRSGTAFYSLASRGGDAVEAPTIHYRNGYYYLYVSFDACCRGAASTYRIMVGRSTSVTGPYVDRNGTAMMSGGGTQILAGHGSIHGPGHQAVITDTDSDVLFYHYYDNAGDPRLGVNLLGYDSSGWPYVY
ncbi:family 43 glycosylhydrolase [Antribacter gilvus]|uniref:family 43 glycosylhydrolase n=1 Tax=Antribacter gilvus TaxID=2304675 RepID=UPI000F7ACEB0|nr:family 43 glycosylhydrolase [Antribacter gilvus]